ncbi:MAG: ATP-dependent 6-phosphofructokinase [Actinomycetota bacterium]|nr:ATP-dependent 6-phosphofructokinase [Actinomycetota bacterium]
MKRVAVVTSGGDAPGMNAAVRAIVRVGIDAGLEVFGIRRGYMGLIEGDMIRLTARDVSGILQLGGTYLGTARSEEFKTEPAQRRSIKNLAKMGVEGLVVIGGNGSQKGAHALWRLGFPVVGVASTVDNDLYGSDITIGVDTALNIIIESVDRIKTTAESHHRAFLIEVMGRDYGFLALMAGIAGGAEVVITPEFEMEPPNVAEELRLAHEHGKRFALVITTDGAKNNAETIERYFKEHEQEIGFEWRVTILGHVQRGGSPTAFDRLLATRLGAAAIDLLQREDTGKLVGWANGKVAYAPLDIVATHNKTLDAEMRRLSEVLNR